MKARQFARLRDCASHDRTILLSQPYGRELICLLEGFANLEGQYL